MSAKEEMERRDRKLEQYRAQGMINSFYYWEVVHKESGKTEIVSGDVVKLFMNYEYIVTPVGEAEALKAYFNPQPKTVEEAQPKVAESATETPTGTSFNLDEFNKLTQYSALEQLEEINDPAVLMLLSSEGRIKAVRTEAQRKLDNATDA